MSPEDQAKLEKRREANRRSEARRRARGPRKRNVEKQREYERRFREKHREKIRTRDKRRYFFYGRGAMLREPNSLAKRAAALRWSGAFARAAKMNATQAAMRAHDDWLFSLWRHEV